LDRDDLGEGIAALSQYIMKANNACSKSDLSKQERETCILEPMSSYSIQKYSFYSRHGGRLEEISNIG
jgi:hypothetical protein